ncbi:hypothetical protein NGRA_0375 [Nosema granulosis]|uniref:Uncharacterized protein n=1 Tax=Nosema granulosis TaxID=83296 RepID=A0A9P6H1I5_9MICR|nr:hypothetical protein NGRA_0375 [Nosema granulosis]
MYILFYFFINQFNTLDSSEEGLDQVMNPIKRCQTVEFADLKSPLKRRKFDSENEIQQKPPNKAFFKGKRRSLEEFDEPYEEIRSDETIRFRYQREYKRLSLNRKSKQKIIIKRDGVTELPNNQNNSEPQNTPSRRISLGQFGVKNDTKGLFKRDNKLRKIGLIDNIFEDLNYNGQKSRYLRFKRYILRHPLIDNDQKVFMKHKRKMLEVIYKFEEIFSTARTFFREIDEIEFKFDIYDFKFAESKDYIFIDDIICLYRKTTRMLKKKNRILNLAFFSEYALKNVLVLEEIKTVLLKISRKVINSTEQHSLVLPLIMCMLN